MNVYAQSNGGYINIDSAIKFTPDFALADVEIELRASELRDSFKIHFKIQENLEFQSSNIPKESLNDSTSIQDFQLKYQIELDSVKGNIRKYSYHAYQTIERLKTKWDILIQNKLKSLCSAFCRIRNSNFELIKNT